MFGNLMKLKFFWGLRDVTNWACGVQVSELLTCRRTDGTWPEPWITCHDLVWSYLLSSWSWFAY